MFLPCGVMGVWQIALIVLAVILLFGGKKIPEIMRGMGRGVKEFKDAINTDYSVENKSSEPKQIDSDSKE